MSTPKRASRSISSIVPSTPQEEGAGATVYRSIGGCAGRFDPFLMLDEFHVRPPAGFPRHPHRGFETVTYMLSGAFTHKDFLGHHGTIRAGDLQWMTAGRGIVHSEMPATDGVNTGLQLWVNLSKENKMIEPAYQELFAKDIPHASSADNKVNVKVIAGESLGVKSAVYTRTPTFYLDVSMSANATFTQAIPSDFNAFAYVIEGTAIFGSEGVSGPAHSVLFTERNGEVLNVTTAESSVRFVLIGGQPLNEPVAQSGPFVMNTRAELSQAMEDFHSQTNGFEPLHKNSSF